MRSVRSRSIQEFLRPSFGKLLSVVKAYVFGTYVLPFKTIGLTLVGLVKGGTCYEARLQRRYNHESESF
jgi:hypothetical protein